MKYELNEVVSSRDLSSALGLIHVGEPVAVDSVAALTDIEEGVVAFAAFSFVSSADCSGALLITHAETADRVDESLSYLISARPRLSFIDLLHWLQARQLFPVRSPGYIDPSAQIHNTAIIAPGAIIGAGCRIGAQCYVHSSVELTENVSVGVGTVLGHDGFGYERNYDGVPVHFPHLAKLIIDAHVTIGNQCSIACGVLSHTHIGRHVKMDDQVYIAHSIEIAEKALIMSGVRLNGRVQVGKQAWLGTGAIVREGCSIGDNAIVGMGSVVIRSVNASSTVAGNPAINIRKHE